MANSEGCKIGYTSPAALKKLYKEIETVLKKYENKINKETKIQKLKLLLNDNDNPFSLFPIICTGLIVCGLFSVKYIFTGIVVLLLLIVNMYIVFRENYFKRSEMNRKIREILVDIKLAATLCKEWKSTNYPHLCSPLSPCVSLQWTYRDGNIVNLPWALLVSGDHIVMRPGTVSPGNCHEINSENPRIFSSGETYGQKVQNTPPIKPTARSPMPDLICEMDHTPYLENLKISLKKFLDRPSTIHNQQRNTLITKYIQRYTFLVILVIIVGTGYLRAFGFYLKGKVNIKNWTELVIFNSISGLIPLLPLTFPLIWIAINLWGVARLETLLSIPQPLIQIEKTSDVSTPTSGEIDLPMIPRKKVFSNWIRLLSGSTMLLGRSSNVVQVLGSITALCCVDKKGILSWPNPTPEKVFFLRDSSESTSKTSSESSLNSDSTQNDANTAIAEVLDLTHDQHSPFKLEFDDHEWKTHLSSLKPLGLAILVNTCCEKTQFSYSKFCGHISATAVIDKNLVPVTNRYALIESSMMSFMHGRCLCELARQIGFTPQAKNIFNLEGQLSSYRHLQPEVVRRDIRFARSLHLASKVKVPFPHSLSVIMRETGGSLQLLTQGTADIILDCCDDYWNGKDLRPLKSDERKRAQDFYQRNALTAYCTAFSYRPLRHGISGILAGPKTSGIEQSGIVPDVAYLELPPESSRNKMRHNDRSCCEFDGHMTHSLSTDSLLFTDMKEEPVSDVDGCFEMQCHQIFIGMVTMQYQAQTDIVQLIERFEKACIRFVHFSKENELRSRVFSEKMGLESGWNCHISLLEADEHASSLPSPKQSRQFENPILTFENEANISKGLIDDNQEFDHLLPQTGLESSKVLSSSAPCAISNPASIAAPPYSSANSSLNNSRSQSISNHDSAMDEAMPDDNLQSLSCLTDSSEQSAQIPIYMSNRAKLPRGIKNMVNHIEHIDNVPLLVSLFTDCSAEATREMLSIMQRYGEVVVCLGSSASNANSQIFLQGDCSISMEPLYPQVCQNYPAFTESNIYNNKQAHLRESSLKWWQMPPKTVTISPIYLSRMLNSVACSISVCRDDPISILGLIELARRFSIGLWNCIQFWSCCGVMISILNMLSSCMSLPAILTPDLSLYLMCFVVALLSVSLVRIEPDSMIMNRATGKKTTSVNSNFMLFVSWSYGCKFAPVVFFMFLAYCLTVAHPIEVIDFDIEHENFQMDLNLSRNFIFYGVVLHLVTVSASFVHREYSVWNKNPLSNVCWLITAASIVSLHTLIFFCQIVFNDYNADAITRTWPILLLLVSSTVITFAIVELCKWEEIKANLRYQRRARLDFGTKLGMNSPF